MSVGVWEDGNTANHAKLCCLSARRRSVSGVNRLLGEGKKHGMEQKYPRKMLKNEHRCQISADALKEKRMCNSSGGNLKKTARVRIQGVVYNFQPQQGFISCRLYLHEISFEVEVSASLQEGTRFSSQEGLHVPSRFSPGALYPPPTVIKNVY